MKIKPVNITAKIYPRIPVAIDGEWWGRKLLLRLVCLEVEKDQYTSEWDDLCDISQQAREMLGESAIKDYAERKSFDPSI